MILNKHSDVLLNGKKVGHIHYTNDMFVLELRGELFKAFDLDELLVAHGITA